MLIIFATILCLTTPTGDLSPSGSLIYLGVFRIILGIGVGGDYPMSASVTSDRANLRKRGTMLAYIFANQGWGSLVGSLVFLIVLACYKHVMNDEGETSKVDGVWRICVGLSLIPAFGTLYQRLTLPESTRYLRAKRGAEGELENAEKSPVDEKKTNVEEKTVSSKDRANDSSSEEGITTTAAAPPGVKPVPVITQRKAHFGEFLRYFSEWRHLKILIGTCGCWFLLDIA
jgi:MFS transporter, PHS family, inorganic phosphate transporter